MNPEPLPEPPPARPRLEPWQMTAIVGAFLAVALLIGVPAIRDWSRTGGSTTAEPPRAAATTASPAHVVPMATSTADAYTAPASPSRTPGSTCADSAAWEQQGGSELIDGYINNQDSGNINVEDMKAGCPQYLPIWQQAQGGIGGSGAFAVPGEVKPGTYETTSSDLEECYWERSRAGNTVDNRFITASKVKIRVTIRASDDTFITKHCGNWIKVG